uniref:Uncharacterized protein n=1 Tax=Opuntia streptacantha TaxID=393608 RepID=A0A7C9CMH5_OPUST
MKDSPQPHCPLEFGLIKMNSDLILSSTKSILVPITCIRAFGSTRILTPLSSTSSSNFPFSSCSPGHQSGKLLLHLLVLPRALLAHILSAAFSAHFLSKT